MTFLRAARHLMALILRTDINRYGIKCTQAFLILTNTGLPVFQSSWEALSSCCLNLVLTLLGLIPFHERRTNFRALRNITFPC